MSILVIVESPTKAKKISGILGPRYQVKSSFGHIRDLPLGPLANCIQISPNGQEVNATYEVMDAKKKVVSELRTAAKNADGVILATDPDREGEAIAWHLEKALHLKNASRVTFHSIDEKGIQSGMAAIRKIDYRLVDAQQTRRLLDRCVGWMVSGTVSKGLNDRSAKSAGRVQSVALRMVVERERSIAAFVKKTYFVVIGHFVAKPTQPKFKAELLEYEGVKIGQTWIAEATAKAAITRCEKALFQVSNVSRKDHTEKAPPPYITSTAQMDASSKLGMSPKATMEALQRLFENGAITYHRTDSPYVVPEAIETARAWIAANLPKAYLPSAPLSHAAKAGAQEAHEAIRPTHPETGPNAVSGPDADLYTLIWRRFMASQMTECKSVLTTIEIAASDQGRPPFGIFVAKGKFRQFDGWRRIMGEEKPEEEDVDSGESLLPNVDQGEWLRAETLEIATKTTKPPERYTQAKLIKAMEASGIGRPSSYASIMETLIGNQYISEVKKKLHANDLGCRMTDFLVKHFAGDFIDLAFTKRIEESLDEIAQGKTPWQPFLARIARTLSEKTQRAGLDHDPLQPPPPQENGPACPQCGSKTVARKGPIGQFFGCTKFPKCKGTVNA